MKPEIGKWVSRSFDNGPGPEDDERETDWHFVESVIKSAAITTCGRRMKPRLAGSANHLEVLDTPPLTRMIGQPQLCQAGCDSRAL